VCVACRADSLLEPTGASLPLEPQHLRGVWVETAVIYNQITPPGHFDTVAVLPSEQIIYEFELSGPGIVKRLQPAAATAVYRIEPTGDALSWVFERYESYFADVTPTQLKLNPATLRGHKFPGETVVEEAAFVQVFVKGGE
jgi:hypothetical protein